jgi:hypothetical protein
MTTQSEPAWKTEFKAAALKIYKREQQHCMEYEFNSILYCADFRPGSSSSFVPCTHGNACKHGKSCKFLHDNIRGLDSLKNRFQKSRLTDKEEMLYNKIVNPIYNLLQDAFKNISRSYHNDPDDDQTEEESRDSPRYIEQPSIPVTSGVSYSDVATTGADLRVALKASVEVAKSDEKRALEETLKLSVLQQEVNKATADDMPSQSTSPVSFASEMMFLPLGTLIGITQDGKEVPLSFGRHVIQGPGNTIQLLGNIWKDVKVSEKDGRTAVYQNGIVSL